MKKRKYKRFINLVECCQFVTSKERICQKCDMVTMQDLYVTNHIDSAVFFICNVCKKVTKKKEWGND